jgi:hypothetical protein
LLVIWLVALVSPIQMLASPAYNAWSATSTFSSLSVALFASSRYFGRHSFAQCHFLWQ